jgi:hypothetical protein
MSEPHSKQLVSKKSPIMTLIEFLLSEGTDTNASVSVKGGLTTLQAAAIQGHIKLLELLRNF